MSQVFALPDLGEGLTEAEIVEWLVAEGSEVVVDQPVVVVETAKATLDVPCPFAGRVEHHHGKVGESIAVGSPLITVAADGPAPAGLDQYRAEERAGIGDPPAAKTPSPDTTATAEESGSGAVLIGYGTSGDTSGTSASRRARRSQRRASPQAGAAPSSSQHHSVRVISPVVRRLARDHNVDLVSLSMRHDGRVLRRADVEAAMQSASAPPSEASHDVRVPLTGIRRTIADRLSTSRREIPDATTWVDVDATGLLEAKNALRAGHPDAQIGLLALLARICIASLGRFPELNASVDTGAGEIVQHQHVNLGFAAQSPRGLVVPVVRQAEQLTTRELAAALRELTEGARAGTLSPADLTGGTFTLNNYGVFGVDGSTPIINHPEAAMVGIGRIIERPWVVEHQLAVRQVTQVGLTFDHRVCDGGSAGGFLRSVADGIERPLALLADL